MPLRLCTSENIILWSNRASQSSRFCRPIKLEFKKESVDVILAQKRSVKDQVDILQCFQTIIKECTVKVHFSLFLTLIDGKYSFKCNYWHKVHADLFYVQSETHEI